jgi:16S rRNA (adenine1518-N6/adenine1519-N6)-dimethyltransferase
MSIEETKYLLRTHRIAPNRHLGQNFLAEPSVYEKLCSYASLTRSDVVLDVGAGFGFLSRFLANKCKTVIAIEKDPQVADVLLEQVKDIVNITVVEGDVLKTALPKFNKVIAAPPYYLSSLLVIWLFEHGFDCAVLILQKEFANRLVAPVGSEAYGWLTVIAYQHVEIELLDAVPKILFYPHPEIDSVIVSFKPRSKKPFEVKDETFFTQTVKWLFTQRNKKLGKALAPFLKSSLKLSKEDAEKMVSSLPFNERRARELTPENFGAILNAITN